MPQPFVIGIAGGTGSGKTTLVDHIQKLVGAKNVRLLAHDRYYRSQDHLPMENRLQTNYDHPESLETELMIVQLKQLLQGKKVRAPVYDFTNHTRSAQTDTLTPCPIILVEGILIFAESELRELFDLRIFVDTDADVRLARRLQRDVQERGRTYEFGIKQYLETAKPMHEQFVEPSKKFADVIIPEGGKNRRALSLFDSYLKKVLDLAAHSAKRDNKPS